MPAEVFKITGVSFDEWGKRFGKDRYKRKEARLMKEALDLGLQRALQLVPYDPEHKTNEHLKDTVYAKMLNERTAIIGATKKYASYNEWGCYTIPVVGTKEEPKLYKNGFRPFLRPGIYAMEKYIRNRARLMVEELVGGK